MLQLFYLSQYTGGTATAFQASSEVITTYSRGTATLGVGIAASAPVLVRQLRTVVEGVPPRTPRAGLGRHFVIQCRERSGPRLALDAGRTKHRPRCLD